MEDLLDVLDVLAIGETMVMVTPEHAGVRLTGDGTFALRPGGAESNVAALLAELGHAAAWAGALGADPLGDIVLDALAERGVDTALVRRDPARPTAVYFKDPAPEATRVFYYRAGSAASAMSRDDVPALRARPARLLHLSGVTAALSPACRELTRHLVHDRPLGTEWLSFDVNHRPVLWRGEDGEGADAAGELLALAQASDVVFVGRDEAEALWGTPDAEGVRRLINRPGHLVVKDAASEAVAFTPSGTFREPARRVDVVDPVGAGDAFAAGWLSGLLHGDDEPTRLRLGHYAASQVLASSSDFAPLPRAEVSRLRGRRA
jgi:2-dehydro-3-deoxygluconokinase